MVIHNKHPIQQSYNNWINNFPESFHPLDMDRFYVFAKTVHQYSRKKDYIYWLNTKLSKTNMTENHVEYFCKLLQTLLDFQKVKSFPLYQY